MRCSRFSQINNSSVMRRCVRKMISTNVALPAVLPVFTDPLNNPDVKHRALLTRSIVTCQTHQQKQNESHCVPDMSHAATKNLGSHGRTFPSTPSWKHPPLICEEGSRFSVAWATDSYGRDGPVEPEELELNIPCTVTGC